MIFTLILYTYCYFSNIGKRLASKFANNDHRLSHFKISNSTDGAFELQHVNETSVLTLITQIKPNKASGLDQISANFVKRL